MGPDDRGSAAVAPLAPRIGRARALVIRLPAWLSFCTGRRRYRLLSEAELVARRRSETVFIFGSGASLNELTAADWRTIAQHDTFGFNWFVRQSFVRCDFHLVREIGGDDRRPSSWRPLLEEYCALLGTNPMFQSAVPLVQTGFNAINGNRAIGAGLLPVDRPLFLWRSLSGRFEPSWSLQRGVAHAHGTLHDCVNLAFLMGWKRIVLTGVDLYDRRYFWGDRYPAAVQTLTHKTASGGLVDLMGRWAAEFRPRGADLQVWNPRSLLARTLPVWAGE